MANASLRVKAWIIELEDDTARLRCSYRRRGKRIERFVVQLEIEQEGIWHPVVRYDNAHGFCHRDTLFADGSQEKTALYKGDANEIFSFAIDDLRATWEAHRARYLGGVEP